MGVDGMSIGSNDLTQLMLGVDRDSDVCAELFDESDPAVLHAIGEIIGTARKFGSRRDHDNGAVQDTRVPPPGAAVMEHWPSTCDARRAMLARPLRR